MNNKRSINKLLPVWLAVSAVFLIAGIILMALLGFNNAPESANKYSVNVEYGVVTQISENGEKSLQELCEKTIQGAGVSVVRVEKHAQVDASGNKTLPAKFVFEVSSSISEEKLAALVSAVKEATASYAEADYNFAVTQSVGETQMAIYTEPAWRGAIAIVVAVVVALVYVGIRFGVGCALTGLTVCAHDALLTACLFAVFRIPTFFYAPLLYAAIAALVSAICWLLQCMKLKEAVKNPECATYTADEIICKVRRENWLLTVCFAGALAAIVIVAGAIATPLSRIFFFPVLVPVALPLYSSLVVGPAIHVHVKEAFDKWKEKHGKNKGKAKAKPVKAVEKESE